MTNLKAVPWSRNFATKAFNSSNIGVVSKQADAETVSPQREAPRVRIFFPGQALVTPSRGYAVWTTAENLLAINDLCYKCGKWHARQAMFPWGEDPTSKCSMKRVTSGMHIPIELRNNESSVGDEASVTFAKIELTEIPDLIPDAIQVNGRWFVPADETHAGIKASTWESLGQ